MDQQQSDDTQAWKVFNRDTQAGRLLSRLYGEKPSKFVSHELVCLVYSLQLTSPNLHLTASHSRKGLISTTTQEEKTKTHKQ